MKDWDKKMAQMNLENRRYFSLRNRDAPLTAHKRTAVSGVPMAKNSRTVRFSSVGHSSVAVLLRAIKGKPEALLRWLFSYLGSESKNSQSLRLEAFESFFAQER